MKKFFSVVFYLVIFSLIIFIGLILADVGGSRDEVFDLVGDYVSPTKYPVNFEFERNDTELSYVYDKGVGNKVEVYGVDKEGQDLLDGVKNVTFYEACYRESGGLCGISKYYIRNVHTKKPDIKIVKIDLEHVVSNVDGQIQILNQTEENFWEKTCYDCPFKSSADYDEKYIYGNYDHYYYHSKMIVADTNDKLTAIRFRAWDREDVVVYHREGGNRYHYYDIEINPELSDELFYPDK